MILPRWISRKFGVILKKGELSLITCWLNVEVLAEDGSFLDELEAGLGVFAHEFLEGFVGIRAVFYHNADKDALVLIHRRDS